MTCNYSAGLSISHGARYASADDISCKMLSSDRIFQQLKIPGAAAEKQPSVTCRDVNADAITVAKNLLDSYWPKATERYVQSVVGCCAARCKVASGLGFTCGSRSVAGYCVAR